MQVHCHQNRIEIQKVTNKAFLQEYTNDCYIHNVPLELDYLSMKDSKFELHVRGTDSLLRELLKRGDASVTASAYIATVDKIHHICLALIRGQRIVGHGLHIFCCYPHLWHQYAARIIIFISLYSIADFVLWDHENQINR